MHALSKFAGVLLCSLAGVGCYKDVDPNRGQGEDEPCFDYANYVPYPDITFSFDVMPVLQSRCNDASCHGGLPSEAKAQLWLGPAAGQAATAHARSLVLSQLVLVRSLTEPEVGLVVPGDPGQSFMMLKLDGCHDEPAFECSPQPTPVSKLPCGDRMPALADALNDDELDFVRSWIALGARDD